MKPVREMKDQLYKYMDVVQKLQDEYFERAGFTHSPSDYIQVHFGSKYAKVIKRSRGYDNDGKEIFRDGQCVHSFVNMQNGDILKGSWKAPVKNGVRGNIFSDDCGESVITEHGPKYLR
jgi:hypothetical protein